MRKQLPNEPATMTNHLTPIRSTIRPFGLARYAIDWLARSRDFTLAVILGLGAIGVAPAFADGGAGGNDNGGAGGDANGGGGGGGTGTVGANDNGQPGSGGNGGIGGSSYTGISGGAGGSVGATTFSGVSVNGGTGDNGESDAGVSFGSGGGGGGGDAVFSGQTGLDIAADVSLTGGQGGHGGGSNRIAGGGGAGGGGLTATSDGTTINNAGTITGGRGGDGGGLGRQGDFGGGGGAGGDGLRLFGNGSTFSNDGAITGGAGGSGGDADFAGNGGSGGMGVNVVGDNATLINNSTITGGNGGLAGQYDYHNGGVGGNGGLGIGAQGMSANITNHGNVTGGTGGDGGASSRAGDGGIGIWTNGNFNNTGTVAGGRGGSSDIGIDGNGGAGVVSSGGALNNSGTITGGAADLESFGIGGNGVSLDNGTIVNSGTISGGTGVSLGTGIVADNSSTIINKGMISGGDSGAGTFGNAVTFGGGTNRLELDAAADFQGNVDATLGSDDTFILGGATDDIFDASTVGETAQFRGFEQFEKIGTSTWSLSGTPSAMTPWTIREGTLAVNGGLNGMVEVLSDGTLGGDGSITGDVINFGILAPGNSIGTLLVNGNYAGTGGRLDVEAVLGDDGFAADRLLISGDATGTTTVFVQNQNGTGAGTGTTNSDGASIIQVGGNSSPDAFRLAGEYVAVGPYRYNLNAFAPGSSSAGQLDPRLAATGTTQFWDYRLQSAVDASGNPIPVPQLPLYEAMAPAVLQFGWALNDSLHDRLGEIQHLTEVRDRRVKEGSESFFRAQGWNGRFDGNRGPDFEQDLWFVQTGLNLVGWDIRDTGDSLRLGLAFSYGNSRIAASDPLGAEMKLDFDSPALALTGTYQGASGWYVDSVLRGSYYDADASTSLRGDVADFTGSGLGVSIETGYPILLAERLIFEPQVQVGYQRNWFNRFTDVDGIAVDYHDNQGLLGRVGGRLQKTFVGRAEDRLWSPFVTADLLHGFLNDGSVSASGVNFETDTYGTSLMFGTGLNVQFGPRWGLYSSANYLHGLTDGGLDYAWTGTGGLRWNF